MYEWKYLITYCFYSVNFQWQLISIFRSLLSRCKTAQLYSLSSYKEITTKALVLEISKHFSNALNLIKLREEIFRLILRAIATRKTTKQLENVNFKNLYLTFYHTVYCIPNLIITIATILYVQILSQILYIAISSYMFFH